MADTAPARLAASLDLIRQYGDLLERTLFTASSPMVTVAPWYPVVWAEYILPNRSRDEPLMYAGQWTRFAQCHYTVLVRLWSAHRAWKRLLDVARVVQSPDRSLDAVAVAVLDVHDSLASFVVNIGLSVELLGRAGKSRPAPNLGTDFAPRGSSLLDDAVQLRNRMAHSWLIPVGLRDGHLSVQSVQFVSQDVPWGNRGTNQVEPLVPRVSAAWHDTVAALNHTWERLINLLDNKYEPFAMPSIVPSAPAPAKCGWHSTVPLDPETVLDLGAGSGMPPPSGVHP